MSRRIVTRASADADIAAQMAWYIQNATPKLAERFYAAVQETAETLLQFPEMGVRPGFITPALSGVLMLPVRGFAKYLMIYLPTEDGIDLIRVYHAARDVDEIIRTRLEQVEQGAPLIPHEEAIRHIEERLRREKPSNPEEGA